ncbi:MAG: CDP-glycerol glycerophosphotransferase family protein [Lachnospiraceae bacterium]|nr:CDP-glycerol glycerophosphotransferase family protein [Lachnospiraceae bacterium]
MKVSVIIPYHNEKKYIGDCLDSLADQTVQDLEAIVVCDHCDSEAVLELRERVKESPFPLTVLELTEGQGTAVARNMGIRNSQGEYVLFLDCDDYLETYALEEMLAQAEGKDVVCAKHANTWYGRRVYYDNGKQLYAQNTGKSIEEDDEEPDFEADYDGPELQEPDSEWLQTFHMLFHNCSFFQDITVLGMLVRKEYIQERGYLFEEDYTYYADLPYAMLLLCGTENIGFVPKILYIKRKHNDPINLPSLSQILDDKKKLSEGIRAYLTMKELVQGREEAEIGLDRKFIKYYAKKIAPFYITADQKDAKEIYNQASKCLPLITRAAKKRSMVYTRRLLKASAKEAPAKIAKRVSRHSSLQTLCRVLTSRSALRKYLYRKVFSRMKMMDNVVLLESFFGRNYSDSPKYIFEYLNQNYPGEYKYVWIFSSRKRKREEKLPYPSKKVIRFSLRYFYYMARVKYIVFNGRQPQYFIKRKGNVFLETWHGTPLKKLVFDMDEVTTASPLYKKQFYIQTRSWDYLVAPNKFSEEVFRHAFMYDGKMLETGYPRNDILHLEDKSALTAEIKNELGIDQKKKVILYAPTWRDDEFYASAQYKFTLQLDMDKLKRELGDEYVLLLRTHYFVVDNLDLSPYDGFAYNVSQYNDIARLYLISDVLITDYSSVFFDYANLRRPMLFFTYDLEKYRSVLRGFYVDVEEELPGPMLFDTDEVLNALRNLPEIEKQYKEKYDRFYEKYCAWEDGNATRKVVETVFGK